MKTAFCPLATALLAASGLHAQGTVQIRSLTASTVDRFGDQVLGCSSLRLQVEVVKPPQSEGPTLVLYVAPAYTLPAGINVDVYPGSFEATLAGSTVLYARACTPNAGPGKYGVQAMIAAVTPKEYRILEPPSVEAQRAEVEIPAPAESNGRSLRIVSTDVSPAALHQNGSNGPTCGTVTVRVAADPGPGAPAATVSVTEMFSRPPGPQLEIRGLSPVGETSQVTEAGTGFTFQVCGAPPTTGIGILKASVAVPPESEWTVSAPVSPATAMTAVKVVP